MGHKLLRVRAPLLAFFMGNNGYIKLHRKIWENPWLHKPSYLSVWIYLLTHATHKGYDVVFRGKRLTLKPGQLITGRKVISRVTKVPQTTVERILKVIEVQEGQIGQQKSTQNRLITIINWDKYQLRGQRVDNKRTTSGQRVDTNKKVKNVKNVKNTTATSKKEVVGTEKIFELFYNTINPTINWGNRTQRKAAQDLVKKFGLDKMIEITEYAISVQGMKYAPTITTPYQLKEKLGALKIFGDKQKSSGITVV